MIKEQTNFKFRIASDNDLENIESIWLNGLKHLNPEIKISEHALFLFRSNFKNRNNAFNFWVIETPAVFGWCSILPAFSHPLKQQSSAEVSTYIDKAMCKHGAGTALMKFVFDELSNQEIKNVFGFANPTNINSIKMCENAGMIICGQTSTRTILIKEYI